ncbi:MAG: hypothetical protein ABIN58_00775 [candidate division WOR-3 bacterium]
MKIAIERSRTSLTHTASVTAWRVARRRKERGGDEHTIRAAYFGVEIKRLRAHRAARQPSDMPRKQANNTVFVKKVK